MSFYAPDAVWDSSPLGMEVYEGQAAIRRFFADWWGSYEQFEMALEEALDLGNGVAFALAIQKGRPAGSSSEVRLRYAAVAVWENGLIVRVTNYTDIDEARAAAERLAEERGEAMSENLDLGGPIYADGEGRDFDPVVRGAR